jgi:HSP20 family protein
MKNYDLPTTLGGSLISNFFDDENFFNSRWLNGRGVPAVNVRESDKNFEIEVAAPGYDKKDFNVSVENGVLTISAETQRKNVRKGDDNYRRKEFECSSFSRSFALPQNINEKDINARYEDGVLKLTIVRKEEAPRIAKKAIEIK